MNTIGYELRTIKRVVSIDRSRTPDRAIADTSFDVQFVERELIPTLPVGEGDVTEVTLFWRAMPWNPGEVDAAYASLGLKAADAYTVLGLDPNDPEFGNKGIVTRWKDNDGTRVYMCIDSTGSGRMYLVKERQTDMPYPYTILFAGVPL